MAKKIIGAFVFSDLGDGCLAGKWINNNEKTAYPEAAKLQPSEAKGNQAPFVGKYVTTWVEQGTNPVSCNLEISTDNSSIYLLKWIDLNGHAMFNGTAMLYNGTLIGSYWQ